MKSLLAAVAVTAMLASTGAAASDHAAAVEAWRTERLAKLQAPDGWLSLVGLHWLEPGQHTLGTAPDNDIVLASGPERLGRVRYDGDALYFTPHADAATWIEQQRITDEVVLSGRGPLRLAFDAGAASLEPILRSGRIALRERSANARTRLEFAGIESYPVDASWQFDARFIPHEAGKTLDIVNVLGTVEPMQNPGAIVFERDGREYRLEAVDEGGKQLFVIFADRTNRKETYGAGRFVYIDRPVDGRTTIDFNRAYNPPCAFTSHSTCPLPPPENRLNMAVTAGEKRYTGPTS